MGKSFTNSTGLEMICVEAGDFSMGSTTPPAIWDEQPVHKVSISKPFCMSKTNVTAEQF